MTFPQSWRRHGQGLFGLTGIFLLILQVAGCHRPATSNLSAPLNETLVTVVNVASTSGCHVLLRPSSGPDLLPVSFEGTPLDWVQEGTYRIRYRPEPVPVYACTAEGVPIQVVGVKPMQTAPPPGTGGIRPELPPCVRVIDPYQVPWMTRIMEQADPRRVVRYSLDGETIYGFYGNDLDDQRPGYLFDCRGNRLCVLTDGSSSCTLQDRLSDDYTILVRNH